MLNHLKFEIDEKLEKEEDNVRFLSEQMDRSKKLTQNMTSLLGSFESRLRKLEETILPVYNETVNLQCRQKNLEKTLVSLDNVIGYYAVSQEVGEQIRAGLKHDSDREIILNPYIQAIEKLEAAKEYFEKYSIKSVELDNVSALITFGCEALSTEFQAIIRKYSHAVGANVLLEMLALEEESVEELPPSLHHFPDRVNAMLIRIAEFLLTHDHIEYMNVYAVIRAATLTKSMGNLKDHQKTASGGSITNISSPNIKPKGPQKVSKRFQHALEKRTNKMLLKASQTLEHSTGLTLGTRRPTMLEVREDIVDESEMANFRIIVLALQKLIQSERFLMIGIIPLVYQHKVLEIIIKESMDAIVHEGETIVNRAKKCIARHDFPSVLNIFSILKSLLTMKPDFDRTVEGCDSTVRVKFGEILGMLHNTGYKALEEFIESVRNDTSGLPKDGTVHELTSNVLVFLEQLPENTETIGRVLGPEKNPRLALGQYIKRVLVQLSTTLVSKSDAYSDASLRAIFLVNNYHHILKSLQRSHLLGLVLLDEPECEHHYHRNIEQNRMSYMQCWTKVLQNIAGQDENVKVVKGKFSGFNKDVDEVIKLQRGYSVPDLELRESLKRDTKETVLPAYNSFYDRYGHGQLFKNREKYVKYNCLQLSELLDSLFDGSA